jgi:protein gp37
MASSDIEWTQKVWNPLTGCTKIGQGCVHCYAETMSRRLRAMGKNSYLNAVNDAGKWTNVITLLPEKLSDPLHWKKPSRIFVNSMSDLFHKDVPTLFISEVIRTMSDADWHTYQVLTKRYGRAAYELNPGDAAKQIWIGFSVCNQDDAAEAREYLRQISANGWNTWVSYEPALGLVDWTGWEFIDWIVVGGESGTGFRAFDWEFARTTRDWAKENGIAFFMKQYGGHPYKFDQMDDFLPELRIREYPKGME